MDTGSITSYLEGEPKMPYASRSRWVRIEVWMVLAVTPAQFRKQIQKAGLSNRKLALACGLKGHSFINRLASGEARSCSMDLAHKIADALGVDVEILFVTRMSPPALRSDKPRATKKVAA